MEVVSMCHVIHIAVMSWVREHDKCTRVKWKVETHANHLTSRKNYGPNILAIIAHVSIHHYDNHQDQFCYTKVNLTQEFLLLQ